MAHIRLNTHPSQGGQAAPPVIWGAPDPEDSRARRGHRGRSRQAQCDRHAFGRLRALSRARVAAQELNRDHRPDLTDTSPAEVIGPHPQWADPDKIVSLDPWGHLVAEVFAAELAAGWDICGRRSRSPRRRINMPEMKDAVAAGRLVPDGTNPARQRRRTRDQGGDRSGVAPARHRAALRRRRGPAPPRAVRADGGHVSGARHATRSARVPAADRRNDALLLRRRGDSWASPPPRSPAASTTSATARTCSAPTSARAVRISRTASKSASRWRSRAAWASSSTTARKAARSAR